MAYACPVCDTLAPDGEHLAHHLAIVAMTRGGEHETWLDEHAAGWGDATPDELAATAVEHAEQVEHELADESAGDHPDVHDHGDGHGHDHGAAAGPDAGEPGHAAGAHRSSAGDEETAAVLAEAREITERMLDEDGASDDGTQATSDDEDAAASETAEGEASETDSDE